MAVELTLKVVIENGGVGQHNVNGETIPPLTVVEATERGFFVGGKVSLDEYFLTRDPEDDSFFLIDLVEAKDV
jgi:hypothetical protein